MRISIFAAVAAAAVLGAGCSDKTTSQQNRQAVPADVDILPPDESASTPSSDLATGVADAPGSADAAGPETAIPAALHGRWGLIPGDCTSTRGDAKGLVTIAADSIRFYESVAEPAKVRARTASSIQGDFAFTGEGQEWTSPMSWSAEGNKLTRIDSEADSRLVYTRC